MNNFRLLIVLFAIVSFLIYVQSQRIALRKEKQTHPLPSPTSKGQSEQVPPSPTQVKTLPTQPDPTQGTVDALIYPNAEKQSSDGNSLFLKSQDDPDRITDWYKEHIAGLGMKTKTFVKTNTNGNILNKLVGVNGASSIRIEITKNATQKTVLITIVR